ncbi:MAG: hypothetical protein ACR2MQ_07095 [Gemmatimonadaceae bacterium]
MTRIFDKLRKRGTTTHVFRGLACFAAMTAVAACADSPTGLRQPVSPNAPGAHATVLSMNLAGDTLVTVFVVAGSNSDANAYFGRNKVTFPYGVNSICDPSSSYGPGTWDQSCTPASLPITFTAKSWMDASTGAVKTEFQPAMRFVPGLPKGVTITLDDRSSKSAHRIDYCNESGCQDESGNNSSLGTSFDPSGHTSTRVIKHFSGYNIVVD